MNGFAQLRRRAQAYVVAVVLAGALVVAYSTHTLLLDPPGTQWISIAVLTLIAGSFSVKVASINARISVSEAFVFVAVLLFGTAAGTITVLLEALIVIFWMRPLAHQVHRLVFNLAAPAIAIWCAATVFFSFPGIEPYSQHAATLADLLLPLTAFTTLYFLLNSWLVAIAVGLETEQSPASIWWTRFTWLSVNYFSAASVAALIVTFMRELAPSALLLIVPLLVVSYLTFQTAMGRLEDSNRHLSDLNRLYLSTIETLAMAIDAKDQITHGHIRRVQGYAVGLAKRVGVTDEKLIKAIEAAALLHDMGKLAVPEYILNKPGRLTGAEFEKMKLHASVGADILSAIDFPYPVVPIVRHHHENWDGSGYPTGLRGTDIPIGARILSVVDCFDALTSDRPYRPRLSDDEALRILYERRGSMYDPLMVDTFSFVYAEIAPQSAPINTPPQALIEITSATQNRNQSSDQVHEITASSDEMLTLYELAGALAGQTNIIDIGDITCRQLRRLVPFVLSVVYLYDDATDELVARHSIGNLADLTTELRLPIGQRLSGWVAANRQTIVNSDPLLDFGNAARTSNPALRSGLSTPLVSGDQLVGVLSLYSNRLAGFTDDHRRIIEIVGRQVAPVFKSAAEFDRTSKRDPLVALPGPGNLEQLLELTTKDGATSSELVLLFIEIADFLEIQDRHGSTGVDEVLRHVARNARTHLRLSDLLFRCGVDAFAAVLRDIDLPTASIRAEQTRRGIVEHALPLRSGETLSVRVTVTCVSSPRDGVSLSSLRAAARVRKGAKHESARVH